MRPNVLKGAGIALRVIPLAMVLATAAGCQSSQEAAAALAEDQIQVIYGQEPQETPDLVFVDIDEFTVRAWQRNRLDGIVTDYARNIGANTVFVRITDETNRDILYSVTAYKRR